MNGNGKGFCIEWTAGPSAQVEVFSPGPAAGGAGQTALQLKYTPPFRSTIRTVVELPVTAGDLDPIQTALSELVAEAQKATSNDQVLQKMQSLGDQLLTAIIPLYVQTDMGTGSLFLEIGIDEALLSFPWELMFDGVDFLCLKHPLGRFVNSRFPLPATLKVPEPLVGKTLAKLKVLLVSVPCPDPRVLADGTVVLYEKLVAAQAESDAIVESLQDIPDVECCLVGGKEATYQNVFDELKKGGYQILHFNGHARFDDKTPYKSALVLQDHDMTTGFLTTTIGRKPPLLSFINACESAKAGGAAGSTSRLDIYGLARAFLDAGAYLLGSRWKISDQTAAKFAELFYPALAQGKPIGQAIMEARQGCKPRKATDDPFGWASYVYYGDPRISFRRL